MDLRNRVIGSALLAVALAAGTALVVARLSDTSGSDTPASGPATTNSLSSVGPSSTVGPSSPDGAVLSIVTFAFDPDPLTVEAGGTVTVTNEDEARHTVTSGSREEPDGRFDLALDGSATGTFTVAEPGSYPFVCTIHAGMKGTVEVTP